MLLLTGCAITVPETIIEPPGIASVPVNNHADTIFEEVSDIKDSVTIEDSGETIDQKIASAEYLCSQSNFKEADSILRLVLDTINEQNVNDSEWVSTDAYLETVVKIYTTLMPQEFIPDEVVMLQFKQQMLKSLDSMIYTPEDSAIIATMICRKEVGFDVPMVWNDRVKKALNYYLRSKPETISNWLKRASFYLPKMKKMFADSGLPQDLAYLPLIESGFSPVAYSRAHASGIWQFISSTGKVYGLRNNYWYDERRDPLKSTESAIRYLKKLYGDFGNWHLALAAYNCGEGGLGRAIKRSTSTDYWQLKLPSETKNYVPAYLAALTIAKNPDLFNFSYTTADTFAFDTVTVHDCLDLNDIAEGINLSFDTLKRINPQIVHWCTPPDMTDVVMYLPQGYKQSFSDYYSQLSPNSRVKWYRYKVRKGEKVQTLARYFKVPADAIRDLNHLKKNSKIIAGQALLIPIPVAKKESTQDSSSQIVFLQPPSNVEITTGKGGTKVHYKVKKGDTVSGIAELFDVSIGEIMDWNEMENSRIKGGQILTIYTDNRAVTSRPQAPKYSASSTTYTVQEGDTPYSISKRFNLTVDELVSLNDLDAKSPVIKVDQVLKMSRNSKEKNVSNTKKSLQSGNHLKYMVAAGDNLFRISQNFSVSLDEILALNNFSKNATIHVGDIILIPKTGSPSNKVQKSKGDVVYYEVKQGDNLWNIAATFGIPVGELYQVNNLSSDSVLMPGDIIKVIKTGGL